MIKILLFGGGGFIGYNLIKGLINENNEIIVYDIDISKIVEFKNNITLIQNDIRNDDNIETLIKNTDIVIDLIAHANPSLYVKCPIDVFNLNFLENLKIVDFCIKYNKRLIQFSTCEVYGTTIRPWVDNEIQKELVTKPFNEETSPMIMGPVCKHRWIYAVGKSLLERVLHAYGLEDKLNYTIIRPFNFIGPKIDYLPDKTNNSTNNPRVFSNFLSSLIYNKPLMLVDGGSQERTYTYIDDAIDAIKKIIYDDKEVSKHKIYNIGNPNNETTIKNFAQIMIKFYNDNWSENNSNTPLLENISGEEFYGIGYADCDKRIPCVNSIKKDFGWECKYDLQTTIFLTMKAFMDEIK